MDNRLDFDRFLQEKKDRLTAATDKIIDAHTVLEEKEALTGDKITSRPIEGLDRPLEKPLNTDKTLTTESKTLGDKIMNTASNVLETTKETVADAATWVKEHVTPPKDLQAKAQPIIETAKEAAIDIKEGAQDAYLKAKDWVNDNILPDSEKTAGEKITETLAEGWNEIKEKLGEAAGMIQHAVQPEQIQGEKKGRRRARRGGRGRKGGQDLADKAKEFIDDAGEAIQDTIQKNAPRRNQNRNNRRRFNQRNRGGYMVWVPKGTQGTTTAGQGKDLLNQAKDTAAEGWEATKEKAGEALDWADKKLTPESQKTLGDKAKEFGDKAKDKADDLSFKINEKITPESQKTFGDKLEEKAFHAKEAVKEKLE